MSNTAGALTYLTQQSLRNRIARQGARVRNPRYLLALAFGLFYFWSLLLRRQPTPGTGASDVIESVAAILLGLTLVAGWFGGVSRTALAFQPAEVQFLFPAPISGRGLIAYKMARSQLVLLLNALVWTVLLRRFGVPVAWPFRFAAAWGAFSVLSLHRLAVALLRTAPLSGLRRGGLWLGRLVAIGIVGAFAAGLIPPLLDFRRAGFDVALHELGTALSAGPAAMALRPFRLLIDPLYATTMTAWLPAFGMVAAIVAVHVVWILAMDVQFQEAAATASTVLAGRLATVRARRSGSAAVTVRTGTKAREWLPLAPTGKPAVAIIWKNTLALTRTSSARAAILMVTMLVVLMRVTTSGATGAAGTAMAVPYGVLAAVLLMMGPRSLRNDLRQDLLDLPQLKTLPLSGAELVTAEMISPTLVLTVAEVVLLAIGYFALPAATRSGLSAGPTAALAITALLVMVAMNAASFAIQNGAAVLFPGWVRLGAEAAGIEAMGQNLLVTFGSFFALILGLIVPAIGGGVVGFILWELVGPGPLPIAAALVIGAVVLLAQVALVIRLLGRAFERMEPTTS
ncbi:MAG TPA: putative ABC exporter domain-containing protein [Gemmatimonadales bacterium]|jgi:hypothetical protein|nr:putative ABC exporter domain-containing protein [Gemmatimonadales bacterium]